MDFLHFSTSELFDLTCGSSAGQFFFGSHALFRLLKGKWTILLSFSFIFSANVLANIWQSINLAILLSPIPGLLIVGYLVND